MKPVTINLVLKKNIRGKLFLGFVVIFAFSTLGITLVSMVDYYANIKVIKAYELRIKEINQRSERKRIAAQKKLTDKKEYQKIKQDLNYLSAIIKKNMFQLPNALISMPSVNVT